jgi:hypothetical protein
MFSLDVAIFHLINEGGHNYFLDWFMPFMSDLKNFIFVLLILGVWLVWKGKKGALYCYYSWL